CQEDRAPERVPRDGAGEEQECVHEQEAHEDHPVAGLQAHAEQEEARAHGVGHAGRVEARENVGHPEDADRAHDHEEQSGEDEEPAQDVENRLHQTSPPSSGRLARPRSRNSKNFSTVMVPMKLMSAYTSARSRNSGRPFRNPSTAMRSTV